jgi:hypothetical protein
MLDKVKELLTNKWVLLGLAVAAGAVAGMALGYC